MKYDNMEVEKTPKITFSKSVNISEEMKEIITGESEPVMETIKDELLESKYKYYRDVGQRLSHVQKQYSHHIPF